MAGFGTNLDIYVFLRQEDLKDYKRLHQAILDCVLLEISQEDSEKLLNFARSFTVNLNRRWTEAHRVQKTFMKKHMNWLETRIKWPECESVNLTEIFEGTENLDPRSTEEEAAVQPIPSTSKATSDIGTSTDIASRKPFEDLGNKQKKRRSGTLLDYPEEELTFAFVTKLKSNGKEGLARIIDHLVKNPEKVEAVESLLSTNEKTDTMQEDQALALTASLDLSKWKYLTLRSALSQQLKLPSYYKLLEAKQRCYPDTRDIEVSEHLVKVKLQALLDVTTRRILQVVGDDLNMCSENLKLTSKWGFDGSSAQSNYKQRSELAEFDDSSVFMTSLVPLKLESGNVVIWNNPNPSSTSYCRPIKFQFAKETTEFVKQEQAAMEEEIRNLTISSCGNLEVTHELHMTMIDGKVATIITDTPSAATCNVCLAKPSEMNNLSEMFSRPVRDDVYQYGLSTLHMWIRSMECLLHISYNLDFKMWSARGDNKNLKKLRKDMVQSEFKQQMGLLIDVVKQGFGTTNDGNTARRFFREYKKSAQITKIDADLIKHFAVILQVLSCGKAVNIDSFREYCKETAEIFVHHYPWYNMPSSIHKMLIHGADICKHFSCLPIGILSEEAGEARNKDFRNTRERHTRKTGRLQNNEDIIHNFLISSDPYISHLKPKYTNFKSSRMFPEATQLILSDELIEVEEEIEVDEEAPENVPDPLE